MFALLAAHALAACVAIALTMPPLLKISLLLCIGASLAYRRRPQADCDYVFGADGRVERLAAVNNSSVGADKLCMPWAPLRGVATTASKTPALQGGRAGDALMKLLRSRAVEQTTLSPPLRIFAVADDDRPSNLSRQNLAQTFEVDAASQLLGRLMVLRLRTASVRTSLVLLPDAFNYPDDYRRVRLWLKWQGKGERDGAMNGLGGGTQDGI